MSAITHQLGLEVEPSSTAIWKWWILKRGPIKTYVEQEKYNIAFRFKNLGAHDYPGGSAVMIAKWPNWEPIVTWPVMIPKLKVGEDDYAQFVQNGKKKISSDVISSGVGIVSYTCMKSGDNGNVTVTDFSGKIPYEGRVIYGIHARTWADIYAKYSMVISAAGLFIVALDRIVAALFWILRRFIPCFPY